MNRPEFPLQAEHLFSMAATLQSPAELIGAVPEGIRLNFYVVDGHVEGPRLRGRLRPVGGDWFTLRRDGIGQLDVRVTIETGDGALIQATYEGIGDCGIDGYEAFLRGELPRVLPLRTAPTLRTAHPDYQWLHRLSCVGLGEVDLERYEVRYDIYAVSAGK
ncbi:MAG TPA: DUF3237 domain-containing protein [Solimonas sp.]|nr:DUF3237 domain-containing protein [Solimonas sp.]